MRFRTRAFIPGYIQDCVPALRWPVLWPWGVCNLAQEGEAAPTCFNLFMMTMALSHTMSLWRTQKWEKLSGHHKSKHACWIYFWKERCEIWLLCGGEQLYSTSHTLWSFYPCVAQLPGTRNSQEKCLLSRKPFTIWPSVRLYQEHWCRHGHTVLSQRMGNRKFSYMTSHFVKIATNTKIITLSGFLSNA